MSHNATRDQRMVGLSMIADQNRSRRRQRQTRRRRLRPTLLALEERTLLSTFAVTNNTVDNVTTTGTLRWAIAQANAATTPSSIEIELGSTPATITLSQGVLTLSNTKYAVTIYDGPGQGPVSISGNNASGVFQVDNGVTASLSGLTITGGHASNHNNGGGVYNFGTTTLTGCTISGNSAANYGGGLDNAKSGTATLTDCTLSGNSAVNNGGGLVNFGTATLTLHDFRKLRRKRWRRAGQPRHGQAHRHDRRRQHDARRRRQRHPRHRHRHVQPDRHRGLGRADLRRS
jgi:hypothetical protein